jgi:mannose-6-phosphate isomerase-like protein (cupin superfamily)
VNFPWEFLFRLMFVQSGRRCRYALLVQAEIRHADPSKEFPTEENCFILEVSNDARDPDVSIARARVRPGVTTAWHRLEGIVERYVIVRGKGRVEIGDLPPTIVGEGDVVRIPPNVPQRITNVGDEDLVFFCVCTPRFMPGAFIAGQT